MKRNSFLLFIGLFITTLCFANDANNRQCTESLVAQCIVNISSAYKVSIDKNTKRVNISNDKEHLWARLPVSVDGNYHGYSLVNAYGVEGEWDLFFTKILFPALDQDEAVQRITIEIYRAHFVSLADGEKEEVKFEADPDRFVVYGKVAVGRTLKINGIWLRGGIPSNEKFSFEVNILN